MTSLSMRATSVPEEVTEVSLNRSFPEDFVLKRRPEELITAAGRRLTPCSGHFGKRMLLEESCDSGSRAGNRFEILCGPISSRCDVNR